MCTPPMLFYSHGEHKHTFYSLLERRVVVHDKCIKEMVGKDIVCSMHGWFILSNQIDRRICQLFNPVSMATIQLPLLPRRPSYDFCTLSCDPNNQNCLVMLIKAEEGMARCYFCRPGDDGWTTKVLGLERKHVSSTDSVLAVCCYKGHICIFTCFRKILLLAANPPYLTLTVTDLGEHQIQRHACQYRSVQDYLVESEGGLFLIKRFDLHNIDAYDFFVGKVDISQKKIVAIENLGGRAIFLSSSSSGLLRSTEYLGIQENTIYFTRPSDPRMYSFGMQKKSLSFSLPCENVKENLVQAEWILLAPPNELCKLYCKADIISPLQIKKSTVLSIGKDRSPLIGVGEKLHKFTHNDWSELPHDVLFSIAEKLSCVNCSRIAMVCKRWKSVMTQLPKNLHGCPIFLHMSSSSVEIFHFMNESRYNIPVIENPEGLSIKCAKYGWLLMTRYSAGIELFFLNPLTFEIIKIPRLLANAHSFCFTSLPTLYTCSVLAICESNSQPFVYHICRGEMIWRRFKIPVYEANFEIALYSNPVFHEEAFYWIWSCVKLYTYNPNEKKVKYLVGPPCESECSYLFENGKKLMSVWTERHGKWVRAYELDKVSMAWKEVNNLDSKVIFLSRNSSLVTEIQGLEDMICFNRFVDDNQPLIYSFKTSELRAYGGHHVIQDFCDISEYQIKGAWIMPNVKQHSVQELSWFYTGLSTVISHFVLGAALALAFVSYLG